MLSAKYQNIFDLIKGEVNISDDVLIDCLNYIDGLLVGNYVYTENLIERFNISENATLELLSILSREYLLTKVYRLYCPYCHKFDDDRYLSISEIEAINECSKCEKDFKSDLKKNPLKYIAIFFKKS